MFTILSRHIITIAMVFIAFQSGKSQYLAPSLLSSGSNAHTANGRSVSYTIGQFAVFTAPSNQKGISNHVYQQYSIIASNIKRNTTTKVKVDVYPNPVIDIIQIRFDGQSINLNTVSIQVFDILGRNYSNQLLQNRFFVPDAKDIEIDFRSVLPGQYFIRIIDDKKKDVIATLNVIKQN